MNIAVRVSGLHVSFGARHVLREVDFCVPAAGITVLAGRSGSGKTTLLRSLNRLNETFPGCRTTGRVELDLGRGLEPVYGGSGVRPRPLNEIRRLVGTCVMPTDGIFCVVTRAGVLRAGDEVRVVGEGEL